MPPSASAISGEIDRESPVPLYEQLKSLLLVFIDTKCQPGTELPSERALCERFGLARMTVRQALDSLARDNVVDRMVGVGTFVHRPKMDLQLKLTSYSEEMQRRGMVPTSRVLSFEEIHSNAHLARELEVPEGTAVVRFRRLLLADNEPMSVDENFIVSSRAPGITAGKAPVSLYGELEQNYGLVMDWGEDIVEATAASPSVATLLKVDIGSPLLKIQRHAYVAETVVDYSVSYYRADRYSLRVPLQRQGKKSPRNYRAAPPPGR